MKKSCYSYKNYCFGYAFLIQFKKKTVLGVTTSFNELNSAKVLS